MFAKLIKKLKVKRQQQYCEEADLENWLNFQTWYASGLGETLAQTEKELLDAYLPDLFGYFLLQCGCPEIQAEMAAGNWLKSSRVSRKFCLDCHRYAGLNITSNFIQLPIQSDSVDIVVLPHVLEFASMPHQVLREVERILIAEGHLIILGFNPWSSWNIFRLFSFWRKQPPWNVHFLAASRVMDWLALLGFDVVKRNSYFYQLPVQNNNIRSKIGFLENLGKRLWPNFGAGYALVARKRVMTLTPIRPRWSSRTKVMDPGLKAANRNKV